VCPDRCIVPSQKWPNWNTICCHVHLALLIWLRLTIIYRQISKTAHKIKLSPPVISTSLIFQTTLVYKREFKNYFKSTVGIGLFGTAPRRHLIATFHIRHLLLLINHRGGIATPSDPHKLWKDLSA
jgi:hypothetical protein